MTTRSSSASKATRTDKADERAAADAARHAPVPLDSGASYDAGKLHKGLDRAVDKHGSNRDAEVRKALKDARTDGGTGGGAPNRLPGHKTVKAEVQLASGTIVGTGKDKKEIGAVRVTEFRQVFDPGEDGDDAGVGAVAPGEGGQAVVGGQSEITSMETVDDPPPAPTPDTGVAAADGETGAPGTTTNLDSEPDDK